MMGVSIITVTLVAGLAIFFRSFYVSTGVNYSVSLDGQVRSTMNAFERQVLYSRMIAIDDLGRDVCIASESSFLTGQSIKIADQYGETLISLIDDGYLLRLASNSSYISPATMSIDNILFRWDCGDLFDKIGIDMTAHTTVGKIPVWAYDRQFFHQIILRNSGTYVN